MSTSRSFQAPPRELVLASAGSGKTYYLSSRILGLLAMGAPPGEVLATTFTRKAAGEILERVLVRLAEGATDPAKARELGKDAHPILARPEECRGLLGRLLTNLHQMNVGTLDAFFVQVARSFFLELGLPPRWTIADEPTQDRIRTEAVLVALAEADRAQLVELLRMLNQDAADRQVHATLLDKVDSLLAIRRQLDPRAVDPWSPEFGVTEELSPDALRENALALATRLPELEVPTTQRGDPVKQWVTARGNASEAISRLDWDATFATGIGAKVLAEEDSFSSKTIPPEFIEVFREAIRLARIDLAPKLRREVRALGRLAELLEAAFDRAQRRVGAYRFDDVTYLLGGPDPTGSRDDLGYRLDHRIRHLLLDEFQDTSLEQWRALQPLASELLSGHLDDRAGVIVADPKQSIYGWRGARPELVHQVAEAYDLTGATLDTSWRSSPVILDLVGEVFRGLPNNRAISDIDVGPGVASAWMEDFTELAGSMIQGDALRTSSVDGFELSSEIVRGSVDLRQGHTVLVVDFDLDSAAPVEVTLSYGEQGLGFGGFAQVENELSDVQVADGHIRLINEGRHRFAVFFRDSGEGAARIALVFKADRELIHEQTLVAEQ